jgi:phosphoribosylformylglycinamidine synthase
MASKRNQIVTVHALVLTGFGINCDAETELAFRRAGADAHRVHLNDLIARPETLNAMDILAIPGGFSFGDDVASGRIFANRLRFQLGDALLKFVRDGKLAIGICNGFQVMVKMGLLPLFNGAFEQEVTLTHNDHNRFENRWVHLGADEDSRCVWTKGLGRFELPVRNGEGKFVPRDAETLARLQGNGQVALRYADGGGRRPYNPNGSVDDIAGLCDPSGRVFGLMPHPEAFLVPTNHPRWTREDVGEDALGLRLFVNAVEYIRDAAREPVAR